MVKKTLIAIAVLATLMMVGCADQAIRPTLWTLGGSDFDSETNEYVVRGGAEVGPGIELGLQSNWIGIEGDRQSYGIYTITDVPIEPNGVLGQPYIGYQFSAAFDSDRDGGYYGPIGGTKYKVKETEKICIETVVEGWYRDFNGVLEDEMRENDKWRACAGVRIRF